MKTVLKCIALATLLATISCSSSLTVRSDYDRQINFSQYRTYSFYTPPVSQQDAVMGSPLMIKRMTKAMEYEMGSRGYKRDDARPDIVVSFSTDAHNIQSVSSSTATPSWPASVSSDNYEENRIIINMLDANSKDMIWQGYAKGQINNSKKDRELLVFEIVNKIMMQYPNRAGYDNMEAIAKKRRRSY